MISFKNNFHWAHSIMNLKKSCEDFIAYIIMAYPQKITNVYVSGFLYISQFQVIGLLVMMAF